MIKIIDLFIKSAAEFQKLPQHLLPLLSTCVASLIWTLLNKFYSGAGPPW